MLTIRNAQRREWRLVVPQITPTSCVAAALVDALSDVLCLSPQQALAMQQQLVRALSLDKRGTYLEVAAAWVQGHFGDQLTARCGRMPIERAVASAVLGHGVVVGLGLKAGGHAVRLEGGGGAVDRTNDPWLREFLAESDARVSDLIGLPVEVFDPSPGVGRFATTVAALRAPHSAWPFANTLIVGHKH